jgi:fructose-bisphosphate aldolase class II/tagatose 1,6-diphosphate aldolase GatY/KbaY
MRYLEQLRHSREQGKALLATNFYNFETLAAVVAAAGDLNAPIILQTSPSTLSYLGGAKVAVAMARSVAGAAGVTAFLHLDHATEPALVTACIDAQYDSVMIDASERDYADNSKLTREVVSWAHAARIAVEAELGYIPKLGQAGTTDDTYTDPHQAAEFVANTGVDTLAVAIGTAHGFYKKAPRLDGERLTLIRSAVDIPLVLHGGSGLTPDAWKECIKRGITKINFATEIKDMFVRTMKGELMKGDEIDLRKICPPAIKAVTALVKEKLRVCGW